MIDMTHHRYNRRTVQQIVDGTVKNYGRQLCMPCVNKVIKAMKEAQSNAASPVSE